MTQILTPEPNDDFVLKPRHSGFLGTVLQLDRLQARSLVGFATNVFTQRVHSLILTAEYMRWGPAIPRP